MEIQTLINIAVPLMLLIGSGFSRVLWGILTDLKQSNKDLTDKVYKMDAEIAGDYVKRSEFNQSRVEFAQSVDKLSKKLDEINQNITLRFDSFYLSRHKD